MYYLRKAVKEKKLAMFNSKQIILHYYQAIQNASLVTRQENEEMDRKT